MTRLDLIGQRFGMLTVESRLPSVNEKARWQCQCDCGASTTRSTGYLRDGRIQSQSCGCAPKHRTHGMTGTPEHRAWLSMIKRCESPSSTGFERYGGAGISVAPEWRHDFLAFYAHMGPRPSSDYSVDRIDSSGNYEPGNVRWATLAVQNNNRRPRRKDERGPCPSCGGSYSLASMWKHTRTHQNNVEAAS